MKIKLYASYGVLAHEKKPVYTENVPAGEKGSYIELMVNLPDDIETWENETGNHVLKLGSFSYELNEVLSYSKSHDDAPCLSWYDYGNHTRLLDIIK